MHARRFVITIKVDMIMTNCLQHKNTPIKFSSKSQIIAINIINLMQYFEFENQMEKKIKEKKGRENKF
jgi:hypothetical protein